MIIYFVTCVNLTGFAEYCIWPSMAKKGNADTRWFDFWVLVCRPLNFVVADTTSASYTFCVIASAESYEEAVLHLFVYGPLAVCVQTSSALQQLV